MILKKKSVGSNFSTRLSQTGGYQIFQYIQPQWTFLCLYCGTMVVGCLLSLSQADFSQNFHLQIWQRPSSTIFNEIDLKSLDGLSEPPGLATSKRGLICDAFNVVGSLPP